MGDVHTRTYREGTLVEEGFPLSGVSERLRRPGTTEPDPGYPGTGGVVIMRLLRRRCEGLAAG